MSQRSRCWPAAFSSLGLWQACCLIGGVGWLAGCQQKTATVVPPAAVPVTVSTPIEREVVDYEDFTGRTEAVESVDIRARVTGYLCKIGFQEGSEVEKGALLFEIDPRPFQAAYDQAAAQIKLGEANRRYREAEVGRGKQLLPQNAMSQSDFDQTVAALGEAVASVAAAQATTEGAKLNLDFTKVLSPIAGKISRASMTVGNLVKADDSLLTTVVSVDPMYVYFHVDEPTILRLEREVREGKVKTHDEKIPVLMGLAGDVGFPHEGAIDFADNRVDPNTGTILVRGVFANPKPATGNRVLIPGLFARIRVPVGEPYQALTVAERCLGTDQGQKYLLTVDGKNEVQYRRVKLGRLEDGLRGIEAGLQAGERVIVGGLQRVRPGVRVQPKVVSMERFSLSARSSSEAQGAAVENEGPKEE